MPLKSDCALLLLYPFCLASSTAVGELLALASMCAQTGESGGSLEAVDVPATL